MKHVRLLTAITLAILFSVGVQFASAQTGADGQGLEVSPPSQELAADPGDVVTVKARIRNRSDRPLPIKVRVEDFVATGTEGQVALTEKGDWSVSTWTSVTPDEFDLSSNQSQEVTATIRIPASGVAGGRYGAIVFAVEGVSSEGAAGVTQELASLFLVDISGEKQEVLNVTSFTVPSFLEFGPVPFAVTYKNEGNVHLKPYGIISITDMLGNKVGDVTVVGTNVFPQAERKVETSWEPKLLLGRYTAQAILYTGGSANRNITSTVSFTVFPVRIAIAVILLAVVLWLMRRRFVKAIKALGGK